MHYLLFYDVVPDYVERRAPLRSAHLALGREALARGELVLGGALPTRPTPRSCFSRATPPPWPNASPKPIRM